MSFDLSLPLNTLFAGLILWQLRSIIFPVTTITDLPPNEWNESEGGAYSWMPEKHPEVVLWKRYTPQTLRKYDGVDPEGKGRILLAIKGTVFDVTQGKSFYGPDGMYGNFAGRDASRGMAKQSFDSEMLTPIDQPLDKLTDLTSDEIDNMNGWIEHFAHKYIICGELVENGQD
ncbi:cytochrome b5 [Sistotremastrum niveocremeum HHB9708]|uniref:Cytochrome b5 n=1 Tax=Sistotremastrum niveocremeum HHB9708 TaxID=1314777 RepID=A0A164WR53_9AGAM|nr:cytochrome b5 [Sistotremastrum niveocremeum HHB9708]